MRSSVPALTSVMLSLILLVVSSGLNADRVEHNKDEDSKLFAPVENPINSDIFLASTSAVSPPAAVNGESLSEQTMVVVEVYMGANNPVRDAQVMLQSTDGAPLSIERTNHRGQAMFVTQQ